MPVFLVTLEVPDYEFTLAAKDEAEAEASVRAQITSGDIADTWEGPGEWEFGSVHPVQREDATADMIVHDGILMTAEDILAAQPVDIPECVADEDRELYTNTIKAIRWQPRERLARARAGVDKADPQYAMKCAALDSVIAEKDAQKGGADDE